MGIRVRALKLGWFGKRRIRPGTEFEIQSLEQMGRWMERVNKPGPKKKLDEGEQSLSSEDEDHAT